MLAALLLGERLGVVGIVGAVLIGALATDPDLKVAYVMTDGGALAAGC